MKRLSRLLAIVAFAIVSILVLRLGSSEVEAISVNKVYPFGSNIYLPIVIKSPNIVPSPTPIPQGVYVKDNFTVYKEYGYVHVVGEIANFTNNP